MPSEGLLLVIVAFALGGVLKGATGAGAPLLAVPVMALLVNVPFAVAVFTVPNIASNAVQAWRYRASAPDMGFVMRFAVSGAFGAFLGTLALAGLSTRTLSLAVALAVLIYVAFRLARPHWELRMPVARRLAVAAGAVAGMLQGATGVSAPASLTFVNAIRLSRQQFIPTMSFFFLFTGLAQFPTQLALGVMTWERFLYGAFAMLPLVAFMPLGAILARNLSRAVFDRVILGLLSLLALKLLWESLA